MPIRVLYIAGFGRSGSTVLGTILGQVDGCFFGGELRFIWGRSFSKNGLCECGEHFKACDFWQDVVNDGLGGFDRVDDKKLTSLRMKYTRTRNLPALLISKKFDDELEWYLSEVRALYTSISMHTSDSIIIDSSKLPTYGLTLLRIPEIEVSVVHLIRDPRGVAYSWQKKETSS